MMLIHERLGPETTPFVRFTDVGTTDGFHVSPAGNACVECPDPLIGSGGKWENVRIHMGDGLCG